MKLDELTERTTIEFPKPLNFQESVRFLVHLAETLGVRVTYSGEFSGEILAENKEGKKIEGKDRREYKKLTGYLARLENGFVLSTLEFSNEPFDPARQGVFYSMRFSTSEEILADELRLIKDTRKATEKYFGNGKK